ncbi:transcriptional regulator, HxlR family [Aquimarina amphilecti]|uniref:Transcriptional regulator, HxlR family n=1 Tax=Aquimarina amphilecti TaxID=1038014 RepID=A0A1H7K9P8_AQUAM|nr:helix-turn-helix domain-containing protein [Aquimarina amphilecti]SEK83611.1 transcriptional regulator, HxlR family [Aquimarina amphilecti]
MNSLGNDKCNYLTECPVMTTLNVIGGKWKPGILWELQNNEILRFGQLKKKLEKITQKMLTQQLRELEADNIIIRKVYPEVPPRVEYRLSSYGKSLYPLLNEMANWGFKHMAATQS